MTDPIPAEVDALVALVTSRHGSALDPEQLADLRRLVRGLVEGMRALRAAPVSPSDEPYPPFAPLRLEP